MPIPPTSLRDQGLKKIFITCLFCPHRIVTSAERFVRRVIGDTTSPAQGGEKPWMMTSNKDFSHTKGVVEMTFPRHLRNDISLAYDRELGAPGIIAAMLAINYHCGTETGT